MVELRDLLTGKKLRYDEAKCFDSGSTAHLYCSVDDQHELFKIYERPSDEFRTRLEEQLRRPVPHPSVSWPSKILGDSSGNFVGYAMRRLKGTASLYFINATLRNKRQLVWDEWNRFTVCIETLKLLIALKSHGLLLQDLNAGNVLVDCDRDGVVQGVSIVDVPDSVQYHVRDANCSMVRRTPPYLADSAVPPELLGQDVQKVGMTQEGVNYIAFCFVYLCLKGVYPFDYICPSKSEEERVKLGLYAYHPKLPYDAQVVESGIPWDALGGELKALIHQAATAKPHERPKLEDWLRVLQGERTHTQSATPYQPAPLALPVFVKRLASRGRSLAGIAVGILRKYPHKAAAILLVAIYLTVNSLVGSINSDVEQPRAISGTTSTHADKKRYAPSAYVKSDHFNLGSPEWRNSLEEQGP